MSARESWPGETPESSDAEKDADADTDGGEEPQLRVAAPELVVPDDVDLLEGEARGSRRGVGLVVAREQLEIANRLVEAALAELERCGVPKSQVTVMAVPGAFELALGAMALAKTRRYASIVALGCVVGDPLVAGEAASGLQLASLETGVPVSFGVLTVDEPGEAEERLGKAAEAVRSGLEMADLFQQLRSTAQGR